MGTDYYLSHSRHYVGVDCIIFGLEEGHLKLLLIKRNFEPRKGEWSLMGGFVREGESIDDSARRVLNDLTGLHDVYMHQVGTFGDVDRDPGERVISVAYAALLNIDDIDLDAIKTHNASWFEVSAIPQLCLDHNEMIKKALASIRRRMRTEPLAFELLPERFTLTQLQRLFESVLGITIDKRNYRRRIMENTRIVATDEIDKSSSRRGARLYRYDSSQSDELANFKF